MLIDEIIDYCDKEYQAYRYNCGCGQCNHPSKKCSGSCYECLYQIHFPNRFNSEPIKKLYDCPKMIYHYVCQYSHLYATELLCAFQEEVDYLKDFPYYHILSLGCGGCTDLMAFERFYNVFGVTMPISYMGIDCNDLWKQVNSQIREYCKKKNIGYDDKYFDVFNLFQQRNVPDANILVISYLISYLYNTKQISYFDTFVENVVKNIILKKEKGGKFLIIINDVNSHHRGRNYFNYFINKLQNHKCLKIDFKYKYFDTGNLYPPQRLGTPYAIYESLFPIPNEIATNYHAQTDCKQTIQLLLEVI